MKKQITFIDLFAGCGGLSLGLMQAGFKGFFAIEKNSDAFTTLMHNLNSGKHKNGYIWPEWLPCKHMTTSELLESHLDKLSTLQGQVDIIAGGPPCQGFSFAGRRNPNDPRNRLTEEYIKIVSIIQPKVIILENVKGFQAAFTKGSGIMKQPYSDYVTMQLELLPVGYKVFKKVLPASLFGVPQPRPRFVMIAFRNDIVKESKIQDFTSENLFEEIKSFCKIFKKTHNFNTEITSVKDAIADLQLSKNKLKDCVDSKGFQQIQYIPPKKINPYLKYLRKGCDSTLEPNSLRLPKHRKGTKEKFGYILQHAEKGHTLSKSIRERFNINKQCLTVLSPTSLATTITTAPDDCLHYAEPRILTVRENARLQSFPDWFEFKGRYTTGGLRRRIDCPRYTQVGNAVPPLMAEILGEYLFNLLEN